MDLSPPSLSRSPVSSPNTYCSSESASLDYPSPEATGVPYKLEAIYEQPCVMDPNLQTDQSLPTMDAMASTEWAASPAINPPTTSGISGILPAEYDPFTNYEPQLPVTYSGDIYSAHPGQMPTLSGRTSTPLGLPSRSPAPDARMPGPYSHSMSPAPRVKSETGTELSSEIEVSQYPSPHSMHSVQAIPGEPGDFGTNPGASGYLTEYGSSTWPKTEFTPLEAGQFLAAPGHNNAMILPDRRHPLRIQKTQKRPARKMTTKEDANFQCEVKGCGKLFSRSYNFKAHMETHDEKREYPFPCTVEGCTKRFVRKTDLQRHNQSVHMKERNHKCDFCGRMFARKDTLRRHMEDGCSKRFDITTMDIPTESYEGFHGSIRPFGSSSGHLDAPQALLPPMSMSHMGSGESSASMANLRQRS